MNIRELNAAIAHFERNPADVNTSAYELADRYPDIAFTTWMKAKVFAVEADENPLHKKPQAGDTTIVHINTVARTAHVTFNGISRTFKLKAVDPQALIEVYKARGYRYSYLGDVALLTKKIHGNSKARAA